VDFFIALHLILTMLLFCLINFDGNWEHGCLSAFAFRQGFLGMLSNLRLMDVKHNLCVDIILSSVNPSNYDFWRSNVNSLNYDIWRDLNVGSLVHTCKKVSVIAVTSTW